MPVIGESLLEMGKNMFSKILLSKVRGRRAQAIGVLLAIVAQMTAAEVTLIIRNTTNVQRREVVGFDARDIYRGQGVVFASPIIVRNAFGQQVTQQLTSDSILLIEACVSPLGTMLFSVTPGTPVPMPSSIDGRLYAWRVDDFTCENDLTAYWVYGPVLQQSGEKAYGIDVWLKSVSSLVVADRYARGYEANQQENA